MAWTSPMTAVANAVFTAAQFNLHVRDNLNETAPAKATAASRWFVSAGANDVRERGIAADTITAADTTTSTSYTNLSATGPANTVFTGAHALIFISVHQSHNTAGGNAYTSYEVASGTTISADDLWAVRLQTSGTNDDQRAGIAHWRSDLNNASNIFRMKYKVNTGTGTFGSRNIVTMGM